MSTELESAKLFAGYFQEEGDATTAVAEVADGQPAPYAYAPTEGGELGFKAVPWPGGMTIVTAIFSILGAAGLIGGLWAMRSLANLEASEILISKMAGYSPEAKMAAAMMAAQVKYSSFMYMGLGFRILVGCAFLGAAAMMKNRSDGANNIAVLVCGLAIFYNVCNLILVYVTTTGLTDVPGVDQATADMTLTLTIGIAGVFFLIKLAIYCGMAYYLTRPGIQALFAPKPKKKRSLSY